MVVMVYEMMTKLGCKVMMMRCKVMTCKVTAYMVVMVYEMMTNLGCKVMINVVMMRCKVMAYMMVMG